MNDEQLRAWHTAYEDEIAQVIEESRPRCETCRWWDDESDDMPHEERDTMVGWGQCRRTCGPDDRGSKALTHSFDPYTLRPLHTAPDFGCVQHQLKVIGHE